VLSAYIYKFCKLRNIFFLTFGYLFWSWIFAVDKFKKKRLINVRSAKNACRCNNEELDIRKVSRLSDSHLRSSELNFNSSECVQKT
jgi:hypothetical protein